MNSSELEQEINANIMQIDGDLTQVSKWHIAALKAVVAITNNTSCDNECLSVLINKEPQAFGMTENQVQYRCNIINRCNDDLIMMIDEYSLGIIKNRDTGRWIAQGEGFAYTDECKHIAMANCIANLTNDELEI